MNVFAGLVHIDQQSAIVRADMNMLFAIAHFDQFGFRIFLQFFRDDMNQRHVLPGSFSGLFHLLAGNEMHGHGNYGRRNPNMDMRSVAMALVDVNAQQSFAKGISTRKYDGGPKT